MISLINKIFWDLQSYTWDDFLVTTDYATEIEQIVQIVKKNVDIKGPNLLDLGCATGSYSIEFAKNGFMVTGVDFSSKMINRALEKTAKMGLNNLKYKICDITNNIEINNEKYEIIFAAHILHAFQYDRKVLNKILNLLRENGFFVLVIKTKKIKKQTKPTYNSIRFIIILLRKILFSRTKKYYSFNENINKEILDLGLYEISDVETSNNRVLIYRYKPKF